MLVVACSANRKPRHLADHTAYEPWTSRKWRTFPRLMYSMSTVHLQLHSCKYFWETGSPWFNLSSRTSLKDVKIANIDILYKIYKFNKSSKFTKSTKSIFQLIGTGIQMDWGTFRIKSHKTSLHLVIRNLLTP